uniref:Putative disease resistance protein n=3 Tax=Noccaea caerulescens TaxID=107243 RepID=A0A1J3G8R5_NOCCA
MAETLLSFGVQKLWDLLVRESDRFKGVDKQLTELKSDLNLLRSFLKDADAKKHASALVRNCVEEIKEIVFDAEDIVETFLLKEKPPKPSGIKKHMRRLSCIVVDRWEVATEMEDISSRISKVIRDMQSFGVQQLIVDGGGSSNPLQERQMEMRKTFSNDNERDFVGLEQNVNKLVGYLVEEESIQVVSICGMGGIGKTTLARHIFNHEMIKNHFDGVVWVCISQQFTRKFVWETILHRLSSKHDGQRESNMTEDELQEKLFRLLETKKFLIILDDMWKEEDWDRIKLVFPPNKGWKVLLTSRNEGVALHADPTCIIFKPECLTSEESWTLFRRIAFPMKDKTNSDMEEMGKQMIKHCGGLPLAIKVLGGLLASQYLLHEWKRLYENIGSFIVRGGSSSDRNISSVYHILSLSYEELPIDLKHCFLYLAHFPEDYAIDMEVLSYCWAAEGIQRPMYYVGASIQEVADGYMEELVKRNMVISERDISTLRFETCHLHDMMREVCLLKAEEENFLQIVHGTSIANSKFPCKSRRIAIHRPDEKYHMAGEIKSPNLRSLLFIKECRSEVWMGSGLFFTRLHLMRVLDLSRAQFKGGELPSSIGKLIHLRYLSLYMAHVTHLPSSMRNLRQLVYLNLCSALGSRVYMPNFLKGMQELTYLFLPWRLHDKVELDLGNLVNLETLLNFSTEHGSVRDLQGMTRLRALSIFVGGCTNENLSSSLSELRYLENLTIRGCVRSPKVYELFVLDRVHLRKPKLGLCMPSHSDEQHFPFHLTTIFLQECFLEEDPMPILEKLLHLKEVDLWGASFVGRRMVCSAGGFPQLQKLFMEKLEELEEWIVEEGSMPFLHALTIHTCLKLKELPDGLRFITSLKELTIKTFERDFVQKFSRGGEDYYKVQHIPHLTII